MSPANGAGKPSPAGHRSPESGQTCCSAALVSQLSALTQALTEQAQAIDRLAASNEALVDALYQDEDSESEQTHYLSGKPVQ